MPKTKQTDNPEFSVMRRVMAALGSLPHEEQRRRVLDAAMALTGRQQTMPFVEGGKA
jgi:hypothetical protein